MLPTFAQYSPGSHNEGGPMTTAPTAMPTPATAPANAIATVPGSVTAVDTVRGPIKPTRKQVSRACDWCRARRIKCDNERPCLACRQRGADCTHKGTHEPRTLPQALKEIDRLKMRVKELEIEVGGLKARETNSASIPTPTDSSVTTTSPPVTRDSRSSPNDTLTAGSTSGSSQPASPAALAHSPKPQWEGIHVATAHTDQPSYYGPSSAFFFISRIVAYLGKTLQQPCLDRQIQPRGASRNVGLTSASESNDLEDGSANNAGGKGKQGPSMNRVQEENFLNLFWESYHCFLPIVDEVEFRRHYNSLWDPSRTYRKPSALVDIILALCLQYGYTFIIKDMPMGSSERDESCYEDATIAGRWYYRRCQSLLLTDLESPSITTVQCYIFSSTYLCCASFQNMSHITTAQAIRSAQILGLHLDPPAEMPLAERELRKRIWWVVATIEAKTSTKLGRPLLLDGSSATVTAPSDSPEVAALNDASLGSYVYSNNVTWLTYVVQMHKLIHTTSQVYCPLYDKCGEVMKQRGLSSLYKDLQGLEACASVLATHLPAMRTWMDQVPQGMRTRRRDGGEPFSVDRTPAIIDEMLPTWLVRQRISLELIYHTNVANLCRPFIAFYSSSSTYTPMAERHAATCVHHSIAHTLLMHQVVTETDLMNGWSEFFIWQWNAAINMIGFILAYPIHPATPNARKALDKALAVFDVFGANFAVAASAATITRDLLAKANLLGGRLRNGITSTPNSGASTSDPGTTSGAGQGATGGSEKTLDAGGQDSLSWLDPSQQEDPTNFSEFMDWALSVDSFNSFEKFFDPTGGPPDPWAIGQSFN